MLPGLNRANYQGQYWPASIESVQDEAILSWIEQHLYLITLGPRTQEYEVLADTRITTQGACDLADAAKGCWEAILKRDAQAFGKYFTQSFEAQIAMFPNMADADIFAMIDQYRDQALGWKLSGAGGGGYLILVAEHPIQHATQIKIRRND